MRLSMSLAILLGLCLADAPAQPPGGPAKRIFIHNATSETVVLTIMLPNQLALSEPIKPGGDYRNNLLQTKDDRVVIASKAGNGPDHLARPWKVFSTTEFNAAGWGWQTVGMVLVEDQGSYRFVFLVQGATGELKAKDEKDQKLFEKSKEKVMKGFKAEEPTGIGHP